MSKIIFLFLLMINLAWGQNSSGKLEALKHWEKRDNQERLQQSLTLFELGLTQADQEILTYLSRGYFLLADLHLDDEDLKKKSYKKAYDYGLQGLLLNWDFKNKMDKDDSVIKALGTLSQKEASLLFWSAVSLGKWANSSGFFSKVKHKDQILEMIKRVEQLDPKIQHAGIERFWGSFYALAPSVAGGDLSKSQKYFLKATQIAPEYLGSKVLYAEVYLTAVDDKKNFIKELTEVLALPDGTPELEAENRLWKKRAKLLLGKVEKYF